MCILSYSDDLSEMMRELAFAVLLLCFLPNVVFYSASCWLGIGRPLINLDYCLAMLLVAFGWRWWGAFTFLFFVFWDIFSLVGQILVLPRISDFFYVLKFFYMASNFYLLLLLVGAVAVVVVLILSLWGGGRLKKFPALLVFNVLLVLYAVHANNFASESDKFYRKVGGAVVESQAIGLMKSRNSDYLERFHLETEVLAPAAGGRATSIWDEGGELERFGGRLLLIVVESWGVPINLEVQSALLSPLNDALGHAVDVKTIPFAGVTLDGELRELCGLRANHYNLSGATSGFENCLPNRLRQQGYVTASIHGASGAMYDRAYWYPRAGFAQRVFQENKLEARRCYSFPGVCDSDLFADVEYFFSGAGKRFMYWLTLNSHSRYDLRDLDRDIFDCRRFSIAVESESCRNLKLQAQFFDGLARLVNSDAMSGVNIVVVGDHSPMILDYQEKKMNFVDAEVPWLNIVVQ